MIYLASPYSHPDPSIQDLRFRQACITGGEMIKRGFHVISPIAHSVPISSMAKYPQDYKAWKEWDEELILLCSQVWILMLPGWEDSMGIKNEISFAVNNGIPIKLLSWPSLTFHRESLGEDPSPPLSA